MPIIQQIPGTNLMGINGIATKLETITLGDVFTIDDFTTLLRDCDCPLKVFADLTDNNPFKNDFTSVLGWERPSHTLQFFLLDEHCNELAELNDNTYGEYFPKGFLDGATILENGATYSQQQQQYIGFKLDWQKVLSILGIGHYKIKAVLTPDVGEAVEVFGCLFNLCKFSVPFADETVRIETTQNGRIIGQIDYYKTNWKQQYRIPGFFGHKQRRLEQDDYLDKSRRTTQIQDTIVHEYTLEPYFFPACLRPILDEVLLANDILISDYNNLNTEDYKNISVKPLSIDSEYFGKTHKVADEIKFEERFKTRVKRNVR